MPTPSTKIPPTPLAYALRQLGQRETGPNQGPVVQRAIGLWTYEEPGPWAKWCAGFASTALVAGGAENALTLGSLSAERLHERMRDYWVDDEPQPGDLGWIRRADGGWHVFFFASVWAADRLTWIKSVEGNASDAVSSNTYCWSLLGGKRLGHARPRLIGSCGALPPASGTWAPCSFSPGHPTPCAPATEAAPRDAPPLIRPTRGQDRALRFLRLEAGLSVDACAARFGLPARSWMDLELGVLGLSAETFARVCRGLAG